MPNEIEEAALRVISDTFGDYRPMNVQRYEGELIKNVSGAIHSQVHKACEPLRQQLLNQTITCPECYHTWKHGAVPNEARS